MLFMLEFDQKKEKNGAFNFMCRHFSSTFEGRNLSFWNYDSFLENIDASSLPFYSYLQVIRKVF